MSSYQLVPHTSISESQKAALINLLGDEDPSVYQAVRGKILSIGYNANEWLRPHTLSNDPLIRRRCMEIVQHMGRQEVDNRFLSFCLSHGEDLNLPDGIWLLARTRYPEINVSAYEALLDTFAADLRIRLERVKQTAESILACFSEYLFDDLKFTGNEQNYYEPDNNYLNRVLDRRMGNPISLSLIYLFLGRRLRLPISGIGLPGHFVCRFQSSKEEIYVDAFNRGKLLTKADCIRFLNQNEGYEEGYLAPVSPRRILLRICANLHQSATQYEHADEAARFQRYIVALAR